MPARDRGYARRRWAASTSPEQGERYRLGVRQEPAYAGVVQVRPARWLLAFAGVVIVGHHTGFLLEPLGSVGGIADGKTRWADWIDLVLPYLVVGCAGAALVAVAPPRRVWLLFGFAAVLYTQGHGIHLAANSITNVAPGEPAHLWDEITGHYLWYGGLAGLVAALGLALGELPRPSWRANLPITLLFGFTVFTNSIEGGTAPLGLVTSAAFLVWGIYRREQLPGLLVPAYGLALVALAGWGIYWLGFPQFSELGWL
jgi:hypothetical protein